ncbi:hypothetical protein BDF14DRAFT_1775241 [Spinellus fusiger]|nr:hypothetical protein BDF14DRAFT_1775241 [Spinellus fusiger]
MIPDDDRMTLKTVASGQPLEKAGKHHPKKRDHDELAWRQRLLQHSLHYCFDQMYTKSLAHSHASPKARRSSVTHAWETPLQHSTGSFSMDSHRQGESDIVRDKAQYDAVVAQTQHRRPRVHHTKHQKRPTSLVMSSLGKHTSFLPASPGTHTSSSKVYVSAPPTPLVPSQAMGAYSLPKNMTAPSLIFDPSLSSSTASTVENEDPEQYTHLPLCSPQDSF